MTIFLFHEMGHYLQARRHGVPASLPYFVPFPSLFGTMGAVIHMRSLGADRRALFDIGVTGPLAGVTVVVTRPRAQSARFATRVDEAGGTPLLLPALEIEPVELDSAARGRLAPDAFDWTIYTSANSVESSLRQLPRPTRTRIAAVGRGTARASPSSSASTCRCQRSARA
jgi:membrane-associated protease RseP (regulator of RpoE activity)